MNRLKYRIWDKEKNEWYVPTFEAYKCNLEYLVLGMNGTLSMVKNGEVLHESTFPERFVVMFSTGLHGKNGKPIYEGDVVKVFDIERGCEECEQIEAGTRSCHSDDGCDLYICTQKIKWSEWGGYFCDEDTGDGCMPLGSDEFEFEILGDIYSTKHLLNN